MPSARESVDATSCRCPATQSFGVLRLAATTSRSQATRVFTHPSSRGAGFPRRRTASAAGDERKPAKASLTARRLFADRLLSLVEVGRLRGVRGHSPAQAGGGRGLRAGGPVCLQAGSPIREPPGFRVVSAGAPPLAGIAGKAARARGVLLRRFVKGGQLPGT